MSTTTTPQRRFAQLIDGDEKPTLAELHELYEGADPIATEEILGEWEGGVFGLGHPIEAQLTAMRWAGKSFVAPNRVSPIVCFDDAGRRYANTSFGGARLSDVEYRGSLTATMSYDNFPMRDHFRRVSETVVMGAMELEGASQTGYFYLTRLADDTPPLALEFVANNPPLTVTAAVLRDPGGPLSLEQAELEAPRADEVLVRLAACGICHSDLVVARDARPQQLPMVLGHEGAGVIEAVGADVTDLEPGDHVVISYGWCGHCDNCWRERMAYCANSAVLNLSGTRRDGSGGMRIGSEAVRARFTGQSSFATHALAAAHTVVRVPDDVPFEIAAPLGCGIQTGAGAVLNALRPEPGSSIAVFAAGSVGLSAIMAARVAGCERVVAVEPHPARRELALAVGATEAIDPGAVKETLADGVDCAIDCIGKPETVRAALGSLASPGVCVCVGIQGFSTQMELDLVKLVGKGQTLRGVVEGDAVPRTFIPQLIDLWRDGRLPIDRLITTFPFGQINDAIEASKRGDVVKAVLTF